MRKNRTLTAAITTALSLSSSVAYALPCSNEGFQFENVGNGCIAGRATNAIQANGETGLTSGSPALPNVGFDFTGGQSVISVATEGVPFAAELFGGSGITLPSVPSTGTAGTTGGYMAVVYTIDGQITQNFNMTFTLDNGATFAENPVLGVKDKKGGTAANVSTYIPTSAGGVSTSMGLDGSTLSLGSIFRFTDHATIYAVGGAGGETLAPYTYTFYQLGNFSSYGLVSATVTATSKVYTNGNVSSGLSGGPVISSGVTTVGIGTSVGMVTTGITTLSVANSAAYTVGWSYICNAPSDTANSIFKVTATDSNTVTGILTVSTTTTGLSPFNTGANTTGGLLTTDCSAAGDTIYRIHVPGDSVISLTTNPAGLAGKTLQFSVNSTAAGTFVNTTPYRVSAYSAINNTITITPALSTIVQPSESLYDAVITTGDQWVTGVTQAGVPMQATAAGTNKAIFTLNAGTTVPNLSLATNDQVMLLYKLSNVGALAAAGQKVNMQVDLRTGGVVDVLVNPQRSVTVATSIKAMTVSLASLDAGKVNISVSSGSTQFSGDGVGGDSSFVSNTVAQIGTLKVIEASNNVYMEDGVSPFKIKSTNPYVLADNSKLKVTGGQFQASKATPGKVFILAGTSSISADFVTQDSAGDWSALWNLDSTEMRSIADASSPTTSAYISIQADGVAEVNTVENAPHAAFTIDFNPAAYKDITVEGDLRKISKDGTVCTVYQIPPPAKGVKGHDAMSIRITNDSAIAAKVQGTLYDMDGKQLWKGDLNTTELAAGATLRIESDTLADITGATWTGRAVLKVTSIMPQMEVMALIRQKDIPFAPLSNLSTGAKGTSCEGQ
jgi:hypothetical protein